jgi:ADP-ribose pyrophosphatase YjhB (NUDIX family)
MPHQRPSDYAFSLKVPEGDNRQRLVCGSCGWVHYVNPKIVIGAVCTWEGRVLLCRRSIEPRRGYWTIPAGYMEERESAEAGACREAREEANAEIVLDGLLAVYSIPRISQVQLIYRGRLTRPEFSAGEETLETRLFGWDEIPWDDLAFPSVTWALNHFREVAGSAVFAPRGNPTGQTGDY